MADLFLSVYTFLNGGFIHEAVGLLSISDFLSVPTFLCGGFIHEAVGLLSMADFLSSVKEFWYMWVVLVLLIAALVFGVIKASKAVVRRQKRLEKERQELERYKFLLDNYSDITAEKARGKDAKEMCEGLTAVLQRKIETSSNFQKTFDDSELFRKRVYAFWYFGEDAAESLSFFFKHNGEPIPRLAVEGFDELNLKCGPVVKSLYPMFDEKNETVSVDYKRADELDEKFKTLYNEKEFFEAVKEYIIKNLEE